MGLGAPELILIIIVIGIFIVPAIVGYYEGGKRNIGSTAGLCLGLFFHVVGLIVVYLSPRLDEPKYYFPSQTPADELQKYKQLLDNGAISQEEYQMQKDKILKGQL